MKWFSSLLLLLCGMWLGGCQQEDDFRSSAQTGFQITLTDEADQAYSRKTPAELLPAGLLDGSMISKFRLRVVDVATNKVAYVGKCAESVLVKEGTYNLTATYGDNPVIALDAPYYMGTLENQQVVTGQETPVNISCAVANALLSVNYNEESLKKAYEDYSVTVSVDGQSVEIDSTGVKSAYFKAGSFVQLVFHGHLAGTGQEVSYDIEEPEGAPFSNIPAKRHVKITLGTDGTTSSGVGISVEKVEVSKVSVTETLPLEFLPKPKLESKGFVNNELSFAETEKKPAVINLKLSSPLQDIKLKFNSTDAKFAGLVEKEYLLSNADDKSAVEAALGITLPEIGATTGSLDFTSLIPQLMTDAGNTVSSTISVDVKANNRWASEDQAANRVYTLKCNKPEFSIAVDERNCWSREFTIDEVNVTAGDPEAIKKNLVYQYYDGANWIDCATRESVKGRIQQFAQRAEDISNKVYKVRALYRGVIASAEAEATLETPMQLPNSGMEEWSIETKKKSGTWPFKDKTYYTFHPYTEGNASSCWWDTNNDKAQGGTYALGIWYKGCFASCVSYTEDAHNGSKAALMYLSGCGDGAANTSGTYVGGAMVGSLFIGSYNSGIVQGHVFEARPMSMSFWYKYKPHNSDAFKVVVSLKNGDKEIATGVYEPASYSVEDNEYKQATVNFDYIEPSEKATTICVQFLASNKTDLSENDFDLGTTITYPVIGDWTVHMGSILKIDDISLVYDK